jgi:Leucine-rich repeat (LRR) protein
MSRKCHLGLLHFLVLAIFLVGLLTVLIPTSVVKADEVVTFPDPGLEAAIRDAIGIPSGDILQSDLEGLTTLTAQSRGIVGLMGLECCTNLIYLNLGYNQISNLSPLSSLTGLTELVLGYNQISDLEPLVNNPGLASGDTVVLYGNPLNGTSINTYIPALLVRYVAVYWESANQHPNELSNIFPANTARGVTLTPTLESTAYSDTEGDPHAASQWQVRTIRGDSVLDLVSDLYLTSYPLPSGTLAYSTIYYWRVRHMDINRLWSPWSGETWFTTAVDPDATTITFPDPKLEAAIRDALAKPTGDITQTDLDSLTTLNVADGPIVDPMGLEHCTSLTTLDLSGTWVTDISLLSSLTRLTYLDLRECGIANLSPLAGLTSPDSPVPQSQWYRGHITPCRPHQPDVAGPFLEWRRKRSNTAFRPY